MIRWLRYKLARLWYWRHVCVALEHNVFTGRAVFWCGRCGSTIYCREVGDHNLVVAPGHCPVGLAVFRFQSLIRESYERSRSANHNTRRPGVEEE